MANANGCVIAISPFIQLVAMYFILNASWCLITPQFISYHVQRRHGLNLHRFLHRSSSTVYQSLASWRENVDLSLDSVGGENHVMGDDEPAETLCRTRQCDGLHRCRRPNLRQDFVGFVE